MKKKELEERMQNNLKAMAYHVVCLKKAISRMKNISDELKRLDEEEGEEECI
ncbi:MAG: hypothetical protein J7J52_04740 [Deltaproteobacteria bacterium]|nr:hypothetical protein [Deltaproteobacteria bacterium]